MARNNRSSGRDRALVFLAIALILSFLSTGVLYAVISAYTNVPADEMIGCIMTEQNVMGQDCYECKAAPYKRCVRTGFYR
jgi:hypothetical protein